MKPIESGLNIFEALQRLSDNKSLFASVNYCLTGDWKDEFININEDGQIERWELDKANNTLTWTDLNLSYADIRSGHWEIYEVENEIVDDDSYSYDDLSDYDGREV